MQIERLLVSKKELKTIGIPYSPQHIARLEKAKQFPQRIVLGQCRVAWCYEEFCDWIAERVARRDAADPRLTITPDKGALRGLPAQPSVPFFMPANARRRPLDKGQGHAQLAPTNSACRGATIPTVFRAANGIGIHISGHISGDISRIYDLRIPETVEKTTFPRQFARLYRARPNTFSSALRTPASHAPCLTDSAGEILLGRALFESHDELARTIPRSYHYGTIAGGAATARSVVCIGWPSDTD